MAWVTPVTNRTNGADRMSHNDMDRITGNINYLYDALTELGFTISGSKVSKDSWAWNDIITKSFWESMLTVLGKVCSAISYTPGTAPTNAMTYQNINNIESILLAVFEFANDDYLLADDGKILATEDDVFIMVS